MAKTKKSSPYSPQVNKGKLPGAKKSAKPRPLAAKPKAPPKASRPSYDE